jgi:divalent metal cation (Fe/Co/Zn/Cd) transporter
VAEGCVDHEVVADLAITSVAAMAIVVMPLLAVRKRRLAERLGSSALRGDAACSATCAYLAATVLLGLFLQATLGWW